MHRTLRITNLRKLLLKCLQIYEHCESSIWYEGFKRFLKDCNFKQLHQKTYANLENSLYS